MLKQMQDGNWVDLATIQCVQYVPSREGDKNQQYIRDQKAKVILEYDNSRVREFEFETDEEAKKWRDQIAAEINQHKVGTVSQIQKKQ